MTSACTSSRPYFYPPTGPGTSTDPTYLQDLAVGSNSRASSRPSTASSYSSSLGYPASSTSSHSYSALQPSPVSPYPSPTSPALARMRPLPTPPTTPSSSCSTGLPRPLPKPPLHRAQSHQTFHYPLPTPPAARRVPPGIVTPPPEAQIPPPLQSAPPERPSIRLNIGGMPPSAPSSSQNVTSPLSPIAFNLPGPRTLRKRREEELARRMKALGFVEAPSPTAAECPASGSKPAPGPSCGPGKEEPPSTFTESDDERDIVLLVVHDSDVDEHPVVQPPPRSASRAAMLSLFPDDSPGVDGRTSFLGLGGAGRDGQGKGEGGNPWRAGDADEREYGGRTSSHIEVRIDVEVEVVTKEAVARTKRRFSRKWVRERKGKRWTERDFGEVLCQLRKLR